MDQRIVAAHFAAFAFIGSYANHGSHAKQEFLYRPKPRKYSKRYDTRTSEQKEFDRIQSFRNLLPPLYQCGRNDRCPCGSGKKFKSCCISKRKGDEPSNGN